MKIFFRLFMLSCAFSVALLHAQSEITNIVTIPLYHPTSGAVEKWGIYLSIGGGSQPGLFEFDTGGTGFYAAYATNDASPWWGPSVNTNNPTNGTNAYDSGLAYLGASVYSSVSFWNNSNTPSGLVSPTNLLIGQSTNISQNGTNYWTEAGTNKPPINGGAFYGDFGMALSVGSNALVNIVAQLKFTNGVIPGFLINAPLNGTNGYLQIGLSATQTNASDFNYFAMNPNANNGGSFNNNTNITYKSEQLFNATMTLSKDLTVYSANLGITPDTGATPVLHNTTNDPTFPDSLTNSNGLRDGVTFTLSSTNGNAQVTLIQDFFTTSSGNEDYSNNTASVAIQNKGTNSTYTNYYYNTGLFLFNQHQVVYDLQNGNIGFGPQPVPEPAVVWLLLSSLGAILITTFHRKYLGRSLQPKHNPKQ